ncbi:M28 family peptidase [Hyunsoonleella sp. SJ7]|uniref:Vacuolar membrane protease n=1 Tax=Hyunsoonleella aquatilis TaxID=2762758 RepID=A0A923H7L7_9FLAO|nr:M28 family peptidase [Hyunsoonleella aquatilis]MBC3758161.1 M28 family peptidase [Hyunsoonleella aquatilis]
MIKKGIAILLIIVAIYWGFSAILPNDISTIDAPDDQFSTQRALVHLKEISKEKHFLGSDGHASVRHYILDELGKLGLEIETQEGYAIDKDGEFSKPINILGKLKGSGNGKALLLMTHYDSEPHSSFGASDAGSGVVTILEGLRAFLAKNRTPKNDILVLITDAEELGLNGADLFVNQHPWAKNVGLALNFEARGSGGASIMLIETNKGNANVIKAFAEADVEFPFGSSLFYSIYKMLPNDTDLTYLRGDGDIEGLNFAFIDDHFDYHTSLDTYERLDRKSLEHQGSYLMPLLDYFGEADLGKLKSIDDLVYFNMPIFGMVTYPFSWILPMLIIGFFAFALLLFYGFKRRRIEIKAVGKGFLAFLVSLIGCAVVGVYGWKLLMVLYPEYGEMLQGFTYNGYAYISAFVCISLAICLLAYSKVYKPENGASLLVGPLFFWLLICAGVAFKLDGASFFIVPLYFGLVSLFVLLKRKKPSLLTMTFLAFPAIMIYAPLIQMFPVGLGLKMLVTSTALIALVFGLLIGVFAVFRHKKRWSYLFFVLAFCFLVSTHFKSDFTRERPKPNSLIYMLDVDNETASWGTYDMLLDDWTANFFDGKTSEAGGDNVFISKYSTSLVHTKPAEVINVPKPIVEVVSNDTLPSDFKTVEVCITSQRRVHRIEVFANKSYKFQSFKINGLQIEEDHKFKYNNRSSQRMFTYYVSDDKPLEMEFKIAKNQNPEFTIYEASYDLMDNDLFDIPARYSHTIPKPFVLNDAVILKQRIVVP